MSFPNSPSNGQRYNNYIYDSSKLAWQRALSSERIRAEYYFTGAVIGTGGNLTPNTKYMDTHNAVTTGANWKFTAPEDGVYAFRGHLEIGPSVTRVYVYACVNGSSAMRIADAGSGYVTLSNSIDVVAGDEISFTFHPAGATQSVWNANRAVSNVIIEKISD